MPNKEILTTGKLGWFVGPDSALTDQHWREGMTLAEGQSLLNASAAVKIDGTDFGIEASEQVADRSFADAAGAQSRGALGASGTVELFTPGKGDTGILSQVWNAMSKTRTRLAIFQRPIKAQGAPLAAGDEGNLFRVITDERQHNENDASRTLGVGLKLQDDVIPNYIIPAATPTAPTVTPSGAQSLVVGGLLFLKALYHGRNVTAGAEWVSSNENIVQVTKGGVARAVAVGTANLTVKVPASNVSTAVAVTVAAA